MKFAGKTHLAISIIATLLSPIFLPIFGQWYNQKTGISPDGMYFVYIAMGLVNWLFIVFKRTEL